MKRLVFAFVLALSYASAADATTITFSESGVTTGGSFLSSDGLVLAEWVWTTGLNDGHHHVSLAGGNPGAFEAAHGQEFQGLRFSNVGGGAITLVSFDMQGEWWVSLLNDGSGTQYTSPLGGGWVTMAPGFTATPYVYIYASVPGPGIVGPPGWLDNVVLNQTSVPEPATFLLLAGGLMAGMRRYRRPRAQKRF